MDLVGTRFGNVVLTRRLGAGGMGEVYEGFDEALERRVAVKTLRDKHRLGSAGAQRIRREARLLSRLNHPAICQIYELVSGPDADALVLELIEGKTLRQLAHGGLPRERVLELGEQIALALAAAHREGIVHRDLKPDNVMVTSEGQVKVLDFGIARSLQGGVVVAPAAGGAVTTTLARGGVGVGGSLDDAPTHGLVGRRATGTTATLHTREGEVLGTIAYMSPEQAAGGEVGSPSDLYSFGVLLQELLTGQGCYGSAQGVELLLKVYRAEIVPPTGLDPELTRLLEELTRVDPATRPGAEDAAARLGGIRAAPARAKARRLRLAGLGLVVAALAVAGAVALHARIEAGRRSEVAQRFARAASEVEWLLRAEHLAEEHDIRAAKGRVRQRMEAVVADLGRLGGAAVGPGELALGRGALALGELEIAHGHLRRAWDAGERSPEALYALGLVQTSLYERDLQAARLVADRGAREAEIARLEARYRNPARDLLEQARGSEVAFPDYVDGLIALLEGRTEDGLERCAVLQSAVPWFYEVRLLAGRLHQEVAWRASLERSDTEAREVADDAAIAELERAVVVGRSDPIAHLALCGARLDWLFSRTSAWRSDVEPEAVERAVAACEAVLRIDPEDGRAAAGLSRIRSAEARLMQRWGRDPLPAFTEAVAQADRALTLTPGLAEAFLGRAWAQAELGWYRFSTGLDAAEMFEAAIADYERVETDRPVTALLARLNLADALYGRAAEELNSGRDPNDWLDRGLEVVEGALAATPSAGSLQAVLGNLCCLKGRWQMDHGGEAGPALERGVEAYRALAQTTSSPEPHRNLALLLDDLARWRLEHGDDPVGLLEEAQAAARRAAELNPRYGLPQMVEGQVLRDRGRWAHLLGEDPRPWFETGTARYDEGLGLAPTVVAGYHDLAELQLVAARCELEVGRSPLARVEAARASLDRAAKVDPGSVAVSIHRGRAAALAGRWRAGRGDDPEPDFASATRHLEAARAVAPGEPLTHLARAELGLWRGRWLADRGAPASPEVEAGLEAADRALAVNPRLTGALLARAGLRLVGADAKRVVERAAAVAAAREDLTNARTITTRPGADAATVEAELARLGG